MKNLRPSKRSKGFDYAEPGIYFLTFCSARFGLIFGSITQNEVLLSPIGTAVRNSIEQTQILHPNTAILNSVIMPNHVHLLLEISSSEVNVSVGRLIGQIKAGATRRARQAGLIDQTDGLWQWDFHDRIVRNEQELANFNDYIDSNPARWAEDELLRRGE